MLKRLSFSLIEQRILSNAAAIHYTSPQEKLEAEQSGAVTRSVVVPLGIDTSVFHPGTGAARFYNRFPEAQRRDIVLFLSRLDPKKGLDILLRAYADAHRAHPASLLVIAGDGEAEFVAGLKTLAGELGIAEQVLWAGFLGNDDKKAAFRASSLFALPSYSENFGLAGVEALASGLAAWISDQVGIAPDVEELEAGSIVPCDGRGACCCAGTASDRCSIAAAHGSNAVRLRATASRSKL